MFHKINNCLIISLIFSSLLLNNCSKVTAEKIEKISSTVRLKARHRIFPGSNSSSYRLNFLSSLKSSSDLSSSLMISDLIVECRKSNITINDYVDKLSELEESDYEFENNPYIIEKESLQDAIDLHKKNANDDFLYYAMEGDYPAIEYYLSEGIVDDNNQELLDKALGMSKNIDIIDLLKEHGAMQ